MNSLKAYIVEKFQVPKNYKRQYAYYPKDKDELIKVISNKINKEGLGTKDQPLDLNDIDTSEITDMSYLFSEIVLGANSKYAKYYLYVLSKNGHFDISDWNVSNVENMYYMFNRSSFNGDISDWDVSNVKNMDHMFYRSSFNGDISDWDVSNVKNMERIFYNCPLEKNPPKWYKDE